MYDPVATAKALVRELIDNACGQAMSIGSLPQAEMPAYSVDTPADGAHGDFAANIAMMGARSFRMAPRAVAEAITAQLSLPPLIERVEIAGPGFINFYLSAAYYCDIVAQILDSGDDYGRTQAKDNCKVMVEFVSANPTGPMHLGNARGGVLGDCVAAAFDWTGHDVTREFYVNDAGNQIQKFAKSLEARYLALYREGVEFPDDGYQGEDIREHAQGFADIHGDAYVDTQEEDRQSALVHYALPRNIEGIKKDLHDYRIEYDVWFNESTLHDDGTVDRVTQLLRDKGYTYEQDGALWYRATEFGGEKDEVLRRSNGLYTYFAVDIAYHYNKFILRGFDRVINVWGADHHGHVARLKGAMDALGIGGDKLDIVLMQLVNLVRDGQPVRMSKRTGRAITLADLLDEISVDAARFYFNLREHNSHFDFDLDLAIRQSSDNPVYYVQYAHARICSILKALQQDGVELADHTVCDLNLLEKPDEKALIRHLGSFPGEIIQATKELDSARLTRYAYELATYFHRFYTNCRVRGCEQELGLARTALCMATRQVLRNCLGILKVTAPDSM